MFFLTGLLFCLPILLSDMAFSTKRFFCYLIVGVFILWGILSEYLQLWFVPTRSFDMYDSFADSLGIVAGYLFSLFLAAKQR